MTRDLEALTEKEKEALRLLLVGHDAKSMARELDLSVHTVNDRLRQARRKLSVASSKQAARLLRDWEADAPATPAAPAPPVPHSLASKALGDAPAHAARPDEGRPRVARQGASSMRPALWAAGGIAMITLALALYALAAPSAAPPATPPTPGPVPTSASASASPAASEDTRPAAAAAAARAWLQLVDAGDWRASYDAAAGSFRAVNTLELWSSASQEVRVPLGAVASREALSEESIPGGPHGLHLVRFRTRFANQPDATETLSLAQEDGTWKVAGYYID